MSAPKIDEGLYSRQLYVLGPEAMAKMAGSSVFLHGLGGLGIEIAKNVALAGVKLLNLNDTTAVSLLDLSTQFYLSEADIGKNRAEVSAPKVAELNPYVKITNTSADLSTSLDILQDFKVVILTDAPLSLQRKVNEYCHKKGILFIACETRGLFASVFVDFGNEFEVQDPDGEEPKHTILANVTQANPAVCTVLQDHRHGFEDGDVVEFREVKGMTQLNQGRYTVKVINPASFSIDLDTTGFPPFQVGGGGIAQQVKVPKKISFLSMEEAIKNPDFVITDWSKMDAPGQLLIGFQAIHAFAEQHKHFPRPWNEQDAADVLKIADQINSQAKQVDKLDEKLLRQLSFTSQGSLVGMTGFIGGVVAQECLKAITGKYTPIHQWMFFDAVEVLSDTEKFDPAQFAPRGDRYDSQRICLGEQLHDTIQKLKLFMIGAGAIGCEMLKNYAMLGVASAPGGKITITDNDLIELSNLNRQFLFRHPDIKIAETQAPQHPKSTTAANAAKRMNPAINIVAEQDKIAPESERKYNDEFFQELDVVVNALDNVQARLYVDSRCVTNQRPLLESGTLGTKGHVQVIVPFLSETYGSRRDPPEKDVPYCTLKSFPNQLEHCIEWSRDLCFETQFAGRAQIANKFFEEPDLLQKLPSVPLNKLREIRSIRKLIERRPKDFDDCIRWARLKFQTYFVNSINQLLYSFPLDHQLKDGTPFWAAPKRPPTSLQFDPSDRTHVEFVMSAAALYAYMWKIPLPAPREELLADSERVRKALASLKIPEWKPKASKKIETDESVKKADVEKEEPVEQGAEDELKRHLEVIAKFIKAGGTLSLNVAEFEKDDDSNFHIDFIAAAANLRARNYSIPEGDRLRIKRIAGRIIPAIATTTAAVSGLVSLELLKVIQRFPTLERYRNAFINLGISLFAFSEPGPAEKTKITEGVYFTLWDRWEVREGDITLQEFCQYFDDKYKLKVAGVFQDVNMIYMPILGIAHAKRLPKKMTELLNIPKKARYVDLVVAFTNEKGEDVNGPTVRFYPPRKKVLKKKEKK